MRHSRVCSHHYPGEKVDLARFFLDPVETWFIFLRLFLGAIGAEGGGGQNFQPFRVDLLAAVFTVAIRAFGYSLQSCL